MKCVSISVVKSILIFALGLGYSTQATFASTLINVEITTGNDDKRDWQPAYLTFNYTNGTTSAEKELGNGYSSNKTRRVSIYLNETITALSQIKNVVLRHNGSPESNLTTLFNSYDNWDIKSIKIYVNIGGSDKVLIDESGNPLVRFTGQLLTKTFTPKTGAVTASTLKVFLTTGSDDLRGGNHAYMKVNYPNGTSSPEFDLGGGGFSQHSLNTITVNLGKSLSNISEIKSITIRHDGNPRSGNPFDTYDNWNLQSLRVALVFPDGVERNVVNQTGSPLVRFTGDLRTKTWLRE